MQNNLRMQLQVINKNISKTYQFIAMQMQHRRKNKFKKTKSAIKQLILIYDKSGKKIVVTQVNKRF